MTVIKVVKDELPFVPVIIKKLLPCMGLNVASLILECFMLSTDNNFTEKFCKNMHSDSTTVVEHVSVYPQFFPLLYFVMTLF